MPIRLKLLSNLQQSYKSLCYIPHRIIIDVLILILVLSFIIFVAYMTHYSPHQHDKEYLEKFQSVEMTDTNNPNLNYGIVIDCGSSGSRVFVYYWPSHTGNPHDLLDIHQMRDAQRNTIVKKIRPGIATIDVDKAANYLKPLLDYAADHIRLEKHRTTLLYILATAGMRLLSNGDQDNILNNLRNEIPKMYPFHMADTHAEVISGKQEGVFTWVAINYVLGRFDHADRNDETVTIKGYSDDVITRRRTVGVIDMGGASTQIAFEVPKGVEIHQSLMAEFNLGCDQHNIEHEYLLYVTTFLEYGGNAARHRYEKMMVNGLKTNVTSSSNYGAGNLPINDPCLPVGYRQKFEHKEQGYEFVGTGQYHTCRQQLIPLLNRSVNCQFPPCSINGIHQPPITDKEEFYGFSEFYYTMNDVNGIGGSYNHDEFQLISQDFCSSKWSTLKSRFDKGLYPNSDLKRLELQCFKSAWMTTIMHNGFGISEDFENFRSASFVNDREVQWTLGAILYKSRFLPLREIQKPLPNSKPPWLIASKFAASPYLLFMCIAVVCGGIVLYIIRLRKLNSNKNIQFNRVPSMSYFLTDGEQILQNINEKSITR